MKFNAIKTALMRSVVCGSMLWAALASAEVVVVVHPSNPVASMSADQVADYFLGKSTALQPVDLPESSGPRAEFYQKVTGKDAAQVKAVWTRLIFTGKATPPKELSSSIDVKKAVASNPKAIGYIEKSAVDSSVKVVFTAP
jgi:ABC-type phosphate transport system substrate-binding protein